MRSHPRPNLHHPSVPRRIALWAVLIAYIYDVFLLLCPLCGGQMRLIASLPRACRSDEFWTTSVSTRSHHACPRRARATVVG
jgi:hypothetical protein